MRIKAPSREEILSGAPLPVMARIGGPAVVFSLLLTLYNLADAFWIGHLPAGEAGPAVAGIQVSWPVMWFLISFASGFGGAAVTALVAQYLGAGRAREAHLALGQLLTLAVGAGLLLGGLGYLATPWLLALLVAAPQVAGAAAVYLRVIFLGLISLLVPGLFYFSLAASGDTWTPLWVNGAGLVLNMALDPLLVLGWGPVPSLGIAGAAYATVAAQGLTAMACVGLLLRGTSGLRIRPPDLRPRASWFIKSLRIGLPAAVGQSGVAFGFVVLTGLIGRLPNPEVALAGYGIADRLLGLVFIVADGLSTGLSTMVGQALGAERFARARQVVRQGFGGLLIVLSAQAALLWALRRPLVALFIPGREDVIAMGAQFIEVFAVGMPLLGAFFAAAAIYRGAGHNVPTMLLGLLRLWVLRIPLSYGLAFSAGLGATGVWWGMSASNVVSGLLALGLVASGSWQRRVVEAVSIAPGRGEG
ncbi:MAG: MATE family efflux transporter [Candidatus Bipolaricaulaceae bacterium]